MIQLTRLNHSSLLLNSDLIEHIQVTPDTLVTLTNGHTYVVLENPGEILELIADFKRRCFPMVTAGAEEVVRHA